MEKVAVFISIFFQFPNIISKSFLSICLQFHELIVYQSLILLKEVQFKTLLKNIFQKYIAATPVRKLFFRKSKHINQIPRTIVTVI